MRLEILKLHAEHAHRAKDFRQLVAHEYGFESWAALAQGLTQPPNVLPDSPLGHSSTPPFYRIDADRNAIDVRPPITDRDWDTLCAIMRERGITRLRTQAMTDGAMRRLAGLDVLGSNEPKPRSSIQHERQHHFPPHGRE